MIVVREGKAMRNLNRDIETLGEGGPAQRTSTAAQIEGRAVSAMKLRRQRRSTYRCNYPWRAILAVVFAAAAVTQLAGPPTAWAHWSRAYVQQIKGTPTGAKNALVPFEPGGPSAVAVDPYENLWIADAKSATLAEFSGAGSYLGDLPLTGSSAETVAESLAVDNQSGEFYVGDQRAQMIQVFGSSGTLTREWSVVGPPSPTVAVDNSTDPLDVAAGDVYVAKPGFGGLDEAAIERFKANGEPAPFAATQPYIVSNRIVGTPNEGHPPPLGGKEPGAFGFYSPAGVAVGPTGEIWIFNPGSTTYVPGSNNDISGELDEYAPDGTFERAITSQAAPGENTLGGDGVKGIAVDPTNGDVLAGSGATVDEFNATGGFLAQLTEAGGGEKLHAVTALAVAASGQLYVAGGGAVNVYSAGRFLPSIHAAQATERTADSAVLNGSVNAEGLQLDNCLFEYVSSKAYETTGFSNLTSGGTVTCSPPAASIPSDSLDHEVHAEVAGLTPGETYDYRLVAESGGPLGGVADGESVAFTTPHSPTVIASEASVKSSTLAELAGIIDPKGADTSYQFQYVAQAEYQSAASNPYEAGSAVPAQAASIGAGGPNGSEEVAVAQTLGELAPNTTYHFRLVARNAAGETYGPDGTFATLPAVEPGLPDHRAYELVTPPNKEGAEDMFGAAQEGHAFKNYDMGYAAEEGNSFLLSTGAAFGGFPAAAENVYVFTRSEAGWKTTSLASATLGPQSIASPIFEPSDLTQVAFTDFVGASAGVQGTHRVSMAGPPGGPYSVIHSDAQQVGEETQIAGGSRDMRDVVLESFAHNLATGDEAQDRGTRALYLWSGGQLTLLNVNSGGALLSQCGAMLGLGIAPGDAHDAVSADGQKIFFTAPNPQEIGAGAGCWNGKTENAPQLYLRAGGTTIEVSAPERGVEDYSGRHAAAFVGASEDGSKAFFVTESELTHNDEGLHDYELYEYNTETRKVTRLSAGESNAAAYLGGADVQTVPAIAADGSVVYFTATGQLTTAAPATTGEEQNLYEVNTVTDAIRYVATVDKEDYPGKSTEEWLPGLGEIALAANADWYTTPDGRFLLFSSKRDLTGYKTTAATPGDCPDELGQGSGGNECEELYRYDNETGHIVCVSCDPSGAAPVSNALFARSALIAGPAVGPQRAMSNNGEYVFFDTADPLVPEDTNGTLDVYEWHNGDLSLISSGQDPAPSFFLGAGANGADVFFGTHAQLVPQDTDTSGDVYDARIDGGFASTAEEAPQCEGSECDKTPVPPELDPGSVNFVGAGNIATQGASNKKPTQGVSNKKRSSAKGGHCKKGAAAKRRAKKCESARRPGRRRRRKSSRVAHAGRKRR